MPITRSLRRWTFALLALLVASLAVLWGAMGRSFVVFLAPGYAQHLFGITGSRVTNLGGVVVLQDGTVLSAECLTSTTRIHKYDATKLAPIVHSTNTLHQETIYTSLPGGAAIPGGCGLAYYPTGEIYSNMNDGTNGLSRITLDASTHAPIAATKLAAGFPGNALGIAVDPKTLDIIYAGAACKPATNQPPTCTLYRFNVATSEVTTFASFPTSQIGYVDGIEFDRSGGNYVFLANRAPSPQLVVLAGDGTLVRQVPMTTTPLGIGIHAASPMFVVTNNINGSMTRFDFPNDDYSAGPTLTDFALGGFRGDLMQAGPDSCLYVTQDGTRYNDSFPDTKNSIVQICGGFAPPPGITPTPAPPASLCGYVYNDVNNNGAKENGEAGISGVTLSLSGTDYLDLPVSASATTASSGSYCFNNLQAGTYTIAETQPSAYLDGKDTLGAPGNGTVGNDSLANIAVQAGYTGDDNNFGELKPASLSGYVYYDKNNDAKKDNDANKEPGIAGVAVTLTGTDDLGASVNMPGATGTDGGYSFTNLRPGTYTITETQPAGYLDGKDKQGTPNTGDTGNDVFSNITLNQGIDGKDNNFGEIPAQASVDLEKKTNGAKNDTMPGLYIPVGSTVNWTYIVTNTGNDALSSVTVTDDKVPAVVCPKTTLDVDEKMTCTASGTAVAGQYTNTGTVTAVDVLGTAVTASDKENYFGVASAMTIVKKTNDTDNDAAPGPTIITGQPVTWTYTVTNTGNVALSNVTVTDNKIAGTICSSPSLALGASLTCTKTGTAIAGQYTNVGAVTAKDPANQTVTASNADNYFGANSALSIVTRTNGTDNDATPGPGILVGSTVTWTYVVTNIGNTTLSQIAVVDNRAGAAACPATTLAPAATMTCTKTGTAIVGPYTNIGTVTAVDSLGRTVTAQNVDHYVGVEPPASDFAITLLTGPNAGTAGQGGMAYRLGVANNGPSIINNAVVTVPLAAGMTMTAAPAPAGWACAVSPSKTTLTCAKATLAVGETATFAFTVALSCPFPNPAPAIVPIVANASSSTADPLPANNVATIPLSVINPAPTISGLTVDKAEIWPPNHKMVPITVSYTVIPACGGTPALVLDVASNEGDASDWNVKDAHHLDVRSERLGTQKEGRVYTITVTATDPTGSETQKDVLVTVPHDQGKGKK